MKKRVLFLTLMLALLLGLALPGTAFARPSFAFDAWMAEAEAEAQGADHILGGVSGIDNIRPYSMTIVLPGETVACVPDAGLNNFGIQGGLSYFTYTIPQLDEPEVHLEYLKDSTPTQTSFTALKTRVMPIPYGDRVTEHPDDPVDTIEGATSVEYVSLYRNDTGLPVVLRGSHGPSGRDTLTKSESYPEGAGYNDGIWVNYQTSGRREYAPIFYFAEPYYDLVVDEANTYGYYSYQRSPYDFSKVVWEQPPTADGFTTRLWVDAQDHDYSFSIPKAPGCVLSIYEPGSGQESIFNIGETGTKTDTAITFTFNLQARMREFGDMDPKAYTRDVHLRVVFNSAYTAVLDARGGAIDGKDSLFLVNYDDIGAYVPVWEGYVFKGWCTDPENPEATLLKDTAKDTVRNASHDRHTELFAFWHHHTGELVNAVEPTETEEGYTGDLVCSECGELLEQGQVIPAKGVGKWMKSGSRWWYRNADGTYPASAWKEIDSKWYYFDAKGYMVANKWQQVDGAWYYLNAGGDRKENAWLKSGGSWYYFGEDGKMLTGEQSIGGQTYVFSTSGAMQANKWVQSGDSWLYLNSSGAYAIGWQKIGGVWYWFDNDGVMLTGKQYIDNAIYLFSSSGAMQAGKWVQSDGDWYYLAGSGAAYINKWLQSGGKWYYFGSDGVMLADTTQTIGGKSYSFNASGVCTNP